MKRDEAKTGALVSFKTRLVSIHFTFRFIRWDKATEKETSTHPGEYYFSLHSIELITKDHG
jgi:hypothetical protein